MAYPAGTYNLDGEFASVSITDSSDFGRRPSLGPMVGPGAISLDGSHPSLGGMNFQVTTGGLPLLAVWSVPAPEKAKADQIFSTLDLDYDGLVNGMECKPIFLQSGLPPQVLAHVWALCDIRKNGVLNQEQFALAVHLIQMKLRQNIELPQTLPPDLVPPTMRMYTTQFPVPGFPDVQDDDEGGDEGLKKEIKDLEDEINQIKVDKAQLEADVETRKADIQMRHTELQNMTKELDTLHSAVKQLDLQRGEAQKRLDDLDNQKNRLQTSVSTLKQEMESEQEKSKALRGEFERRQLSQREQDEELARKNSELQTLQREEVSLQQKVDAQQRVLISLEKSVTEGDARIALLESHITKVETLNTSIEEAIAQFSTALTDHDTSGVNPIYLQTSASELTYNAGTLNFDPIIPAAVAPSMAPSYPTEDPFLGEDPFSKASASHAFGGVAAEDPWGASPFGGGESTMDAFGAFGGGFPPESPLPALPPKKASAGQMQQQSALPARQPPPRPAPPKAGNRGTTGKKEQPSPARDTFEGDPWGSGGGGGADGGEGVGYAFPAFQQPNTASFATDFDDFGGRF